MDGCGPPAEGGSWQRESDRRAARTRKSHSLPRLVGLSFLLLEMGNRCDEINVAECAKCAGKYCAGTPVLVDDRKVP